MLGSVRSETREYWETVFVFLFDKSLDHNTVSHNDCFSVDYWMLFVEELQVFFACYIQQTTNILPCFSVSSIYYSYFMSLFYKYVSFWSSPEGIPYCTERNFFDVGGSMLSQILANFHMDSFNNITLKPLSLTFLWFEVCWKLYPEATCLFCLSTTGIKIVRRLKKLFASHTNFLHHAVGCEQRMHRFVVDL